MSARLDATLRRLHAEGRAGLSVFLPFGFPDPAASQALMHAATKGGADWLEVGFPFSDPCADGPILQAASAQAIAGGASVEGGLRAVRDLRAAHPGLPLIVMTYANIVHYRGWEPFAADIAHAGADGLIVADLPLEEARPLRAALQRHGLAHVPMVAPTTAPERMAQVAATATGFLYVVGNVGLTGQSGLGHRVESTVKAARAAAPRTPLAVGFGVRTPQDVARLRAAGADAVIVGSHVVALVQGGGGPAELEAEVRRLRSPC